MTVELNWHVAVALVALLTLTVVVSTLGKLHTGKASVLAALRAVLQLAAVSLIIVACMQHIVLACLFVLVMLAVAVWTTAKRTDTRNSLGWVAVAVLAGFLPVVGIILISGTMPWDGRALIPIGGIVAGNMMTAHTLLGRRAFAELRANIGVYEAGLALGFTRRESIGMVIHPILREALVPNLDQTSTVGLVTLPGAFIGVLLGGGSPVQAGAAQILVLLAIMAGQTCVVYVAYLLMSSHRDLPSDLKTALHA